MRAARDALLCIAGCGGTNGAQFAARGRTLRKERIVRKSRHLARLLLVVAALPLSGCGIERIGTMPIGGVAGDEFADNPLLNQVTVGDVTRGFRYFVGALDGRPELREGIIEVTVGQIMQIEELQGLLDTFGLSEEEFAGLVRIVLGDVSPTTALAGFDFFGAPFGLGVGDVEANSLALTPEQRDHIRAIVTQRQAGVQAAREQAHRDIVTAMTEEQVARLGAAGLGDFDFTVDGYDPPPEQPFFARLVEALGLADEQVAEIEAERETLRNSVAAVHQEAREAFMNVLTDAQLEALERIEGVDRVAPQ